MRSAFTLPSFAKVNLGLRVFGKRPDGFHDLCTIFQTVSLADRLTFSRSDEIRLTCSDPALPLDGTNLVIKAAKALRASCGSEQGVTIHLEKFTPSPGGLGGGSSNAAVTLLGLRELWNVDVPDNDLIKIAGDLGSDVPFFLFGGTALGTGRGEMIENIEETDIPYMLVVTPSVHVSTREVFSAIEAENLTTDARNRILRVCRDREGPAGLNVPELINDLETPVIAMFPEVGEVKNALLELGARKAQMSGSGASVFGIFENEETRQAALKALGQKPTWRSFAVATVSRDRYCEELNALGCFR